jgi:CheY-like chemotaxis protein
MSGTILLADDSLTIQKVVELTFADTEYRVVAVSSGDELLNRLGDSQPDLIICDVIMPGKDGYEVCQQIKSSPDWLHLPVILLTGTFEPFDRDRAIAAGCSEIITKPFEARKLVDTVERLIGVPETATPQTTETASFAGESEVWPEEATPVGIPSEAEPEDFGTQLSVPATEEDGIEFTTSGFAEMEAAGRTPGEAPVEAASDDGLDYEFDGPTTGAPGATTGAADATPPPSEDLSAQTVRIDMASLADAEDAVAAADDLIEPAPEPFTATDDEPFEAPVEEAEAAAIKDEPSMADTSPVDLPPEDTNPVQAPQGDPAFQLSDDDIDRIARRVIDLASDRLEQIAWEIVPDMAEIVVRQRVRELEAESEASTPDPVQ